MARRPVGAKRPLPRPCQASLGPSLHQPPPVSSLSGASGKCSLSPFSPKDCSFHKEGNVLALSDIRFHAEQTAVKIYPRNPKAGRLPRGHLSQLRTGWVGVPGWDRLQGQGQGLRGKCTQWRKLLRGVIKKYGECLNFKNLLQ